MIYFAQHGDDGPIKIGVTDCVERRIGGLQNASPIPIRLLATCEGGVKHEKHLHQRFATLRVRGEWFRPEAELLAYIAALSDDAVVAELGISVECEQNAERRKKGRRRARGTGTIFFLKKRQRWIARKVIRRASDGKRVVVEKWAETQGEVIRKMAEAEAALAR